MKVFLGDFLDHFLQNHFVEDLLAAPTVIRNSTTDAISEMLGAFENTQNLRLRSNSITEPFHEVFRNFQNIFKKLVRSPFSSITFCKLQPYNLQKKPTIQIFHLLLFGGDWYTNSQLGKGNVRIPLQALSQQFEKVSERSQEPFSVESVFSIVTPSFIPDFRVIFHVIWKVIFSRIHYQNKEAAI